MTIDGGDSPRLQRLVRQLKFYPIVFVVSWAPLVGSRQIVPFRVSKCKTHILFQMATRLVQLIDPKLGSTFNVILLNTIIRPGFLQV